ncbi:hypothetical protein YB2330_000130 [Saitoella coloradoensis]
MVDVQTPQPATASEVTTSPTDPSKKRKRDDENGASKSIGPNTFRDFHRVFSEQRGGQLVINTTLRPPAPSSQPAPTTTPSETISFKLLKGGYKSLNELEADITYSARVFANTLPTTSRRYRDADEFYKYAKRLIAREQANDVKVVATQEGVDALAPGPKNPPQQPLMRPEEKTVLTVLSGAQMLFSSVTKRATLDERPLDVTNYGARFAEATKIVPMAPVPNTATLGTVAPDFSKAAEEKDEDDVKKLPNAKWIGYDPYATFGPVMEQGGVSYGADVNSMVWCETKGRKALRKVLGMEEKKEDKVGADEKAAVEEYKAPEPVEIDEQLILAWEPEPEPKPTTTPSVPVPTPTLPPLSQITNLLKELRDLQSSRLALPTPKDSQPLPPSPEEKDLATRIQTLIVDTIAAHPELTPAALLPVTSVPFPTKAVTIPTLEKSYIGSLSTLSEAAPPAPPAPPPPVPMPPTHTLPIAYPPASMMMTPGHGVPPAPPEWVQRQLANGAVLMTPGPGMGGMTPMGMQHGPGGMMVGSPMGPAGTPTRPGGMVRGMSGLGGQLGPSGLGPGPGVRR